MPSAFLPSSFTPWPRAVRYSLTGAALCALGACSSLTTPSPSWQRALAQPTPPAVWLLGEQHDAPAHQQWQRASVQALAQQGHLAALVLEMAEAGTSTAGLPPDAPASQVQAALRWDDAGWPWAHYGPVALAAVRAGVPVLGGNLPRTQLGRAQQEAALDTHLSAPALARQHAAVREGHCQLLPEGQIAPMTRIQLARDRSMAQVVQQALQPGRSVLLVAGFGHVQRSLGVPTWLPANLEVKVAIAQAGQALPAIEKEADYLEITPAIPPRDHCAALRARWPQAPKT